MTPAEQLALEWLRREGASHQQTMAERDQARADADDLRKRLAELEAQQSPTPPHVETPRGPAMETR